jgi:uncharacterized protein
MATQSDAKKIARQFVEACLKKGIPVIEAILFGSFAKGYAGKNSDIDIALISSSFGNNIINNARQTALANYEFPDIEVHHFSPDEFQQESPFVNEIKRTGLRIY